MRAYDQPELANGIDSIYLIVWSSSATSSYLRTLMDLANNKQILFIVCQIYKCSQVSIPAL